MKKKNIRSQIKKIEQSYQYDAIVPYALLIHSIAIPIHSISTVIHSYQQYIIVFIIITHILDNRTSVIDHRYYIDPPPTYDMMRE